MPLRRLTSLIPRPHHLAEVVKRAANLVPGLPGSGKKREEPMTPLSYPPPAKPVVQPKAAAKSKPPKPKPKPPAKPKRPKPPKAKAPRKPPKAKPKDPHHGLNSPVGQPDPTEWPDPYDKREDPRDPPDPDGEPFGDEPHPVPGATSTSEPPPDQDPEAEERREKLDREKLDE